MSAGWLKAGALGGVLALVALPGTASAAPAAIVLHPAAGTVATIPSVEVEQGCPAPADAWVVSLSGPGFPADGTVWAVSDVGFSAAGPFTVLPGSTFGELAAGVGTAYQPGRYALTLGCLDTATLTVVESWETALWFVTATSWQTVDPGEAGGPAPTPTPTATPTAPAPGDPEPGPTEPQPDPQTVVATVPLGALIISTPYTPSSPLDLGAMVLRPDALAFTASAAFGGPSTDPGDPLGKEIKVVDTRPGSNGWDVSASSNGGLSSGTALISGDHVGLTGLVVDALPGNALEAADVTLIDAPAHDPAVPGDGWRGLLDNPVIAHADAPGIGTIGIRGLLTVNAPTTTAPGTYTGEIVFTII